MAITAPQARAVNVTARGRLETNRKVLWAMVAVCCVINATAAYVLRVWHPEPFGWGGDFYTEALAPLKLLAHGHVLTFIRTGPAYFGGVVIEAGLALPGIWLGATGSVVYYLAVLPGVIAPPLLAGWLLHRRGAITLRVAELPLALLVFNPVTLCCLGFGHPEDMLAACLLIAAVMESARDSGRAAVILLVVASAVQPWAFLAAPLVWSVAADPRRSGIETVVGAALFWLPIVVIREVSIGPGGTAGTLGVGAGGLNNPEQFFYWLGNGNRLAQDAHLLIALAAVVLTVLWHRTQRRNPAADRTTEALWLLALLMLIRCAFDPWDTPYYHLPFLMVLMTLDARSRRRLPLLSVGASIAAYLLVSPDAHVATAHPSQVAARYSLAAGAALVLLATRVYAPRGWEAGHDTVQALVSALAPRRLGQKSITPGPETPETGAMVPATENSFNRS